MHRNNRDNELFEVTLFFLNGERITVNCHWFDKVVDGDHVYWSWGSPDDATIPRIEWFEASQVQAVVKKKIK